MPRKKESYESLVEKLENIVDKMENEELSLEESMKMYEEGINISNKLYKKLNEAEGKIKVLMESGEEDFVDKEDLDK